MSYPKSRLVYNRGRHGQLMNEEIVGGGAVAYFEGGLSDPGAIECSQWLKAILTDGEPLVKPEQAFVVTQILESEREREYL